MQTRIVIEDDAETMSIDSLSDSDSEWALSPPAMRGAAGAAGAATRKAAGSPTLSAFDGRNRRLAQHQLLSAMAV
jgi:hypothetical protein